MPIFTKLRRRTPSSTITAPRKRPQSEAQAVPDNHRRPSGAQTAHEPRANASRAALSLRTKSIQAARHQPLTGDKTETGERHMSRAPTAFEQREAPQRRPISGARAAPKTSRKHATGARKLHQRACVALELCFRDTRAMRQRRPSLGRKCASGNREPPRRRQGAAQAPLGRRRSAA